MVSTDFATAYPEALATWVEQQNRAVALIQEDKAAAVEAIAAELNLDAEEAEKQIDQLIFLNAAEQASPITSAPPTTPAGWPNTSG